MPDRPNPITLASAGLPLAASFDFLFDLIWRAVPMGILLAAFTAQAQRQPLPASVQACRHDLDAAERLRCYDDEIDRLTMAPVSAPALPAPALTSRAVSASAVPAPAPISPAAPAPVVPASAAPAMTGPALPAPAMPASAVPAPAPISPALTSSATPAPAVPASAVPAPALTAPAVSASAVPAPAPPAAAERAGGLLQPTLVSAKIASLRFRQSGAAIITLDNGQTWTQYGPEGRVPLGPGNSVTIRPGWLGSHLLVGPSGWITKVHLIPSDGLDH